jgi:hypothetical protein
MTLALKRGTANRAWRWMLAVDGAIFVAAFADDLYFHVPLLEYIQYLVTYRFGFARRALVGTIVSWFTDIVPIWWVYAIGLTAWIATLVLFVAAFRKVFGLTEKNFALFVFLAGSPFFFKNFMISLGYFDIYGCLWALVALLIPVGAFYPLLIAAGCVGLILMHHLHFLLYVPTIGFIVAVRYGLLPGFSAAKLCYGAVPALVLSAAFVATALFGRMPVPVETFLTYVSARASRPIDPYAAHLWYSTLGQEMRATWSLIGKNSARFPVYAALIALHFPVASYFRAMIRALPSPLHRNVSVAALAAISIGYVVIFAVVYDYSRWVSNWAVCMFLVMHAVRLLPSAAAADGETPVEPSKKTNLVLGWIATVIPRVGVTIPF